MDKIVHDKDVQVTHQLNLTKITYVLDTLMASILFCHCSEEYLFREGAGEDEDADV